MKEYMDGKSSALSSGKGFTNKLLVSVGALLVAAAIAVMFYLDRADGGFRGFSRGADRLCGKAEDVLKKSESFNQETVLSRLGMNLYNGFCFRLDDNIGKAMLTAKKDAASAHGMSRGLKFEFYDKDAGLFRLNRGALGHQSGSLIITYEKGQYLFNPLNERPLHILKEDLSTIIIRAKHAKGKKMVLHWNKSPEKDETVMERFRRTVVDVVPDGGLHDYLIRVDTAMNLGSPYLENIMLQASDSPGDKVEIDRIEFLSKEDEFAKNAAGVSYISMKGETHRALFMVSGMKATYQIELPDKDPALTFGLSVLDPKKPASCQVEVDDGVKKAVVFETVVSNAGKWEEARVDLGGYKGRKVKLSLITAGHQAGIVLWKSPMVSTMPAKRFNVVIYLEDALRADHLSAYGYQRQTSPQKDRVAKEGAIFYRAFSQSPKTIVSVPSILTGLYPTATGVWTSPGCLDEEYLTLAEVMRAQGFATGSFVQNPYAGPLVGLHQGYDYFLQAGDRPEDLIGGQLFNWLESNKDKNFFAYLHFIDPHGPFDPGKPFDSWFREDPGTTPVKLDPQYFWVKPDWYGRPTSEGLINLYDGEIRRNDSNLPRFISKLKDMGVYEHTLIIFMSDHGEFLGDHGMWEHHPPGYREVLNVPLIMVYPDGIKPDTKVWQNVQSVDVMPTVLEYAGINASDMLLEGDSLVSLVNGENLDYWGDRVVVSDEVFYRKNKSDLRVLGSIIYHDYHYLRTGWKGSLREMLFNLDEDEEERHNLFDKDASMKEELERRLGDIQKTNVNIWQNVTKGKNQSIMVDADLRDKLKALGYVQ